MSDERLREAERRWRETGSIEDEAELLRQRVRTGELPLAHVAAAARLDYPAAAMVLDNESAPSFEECLASMGKAAQIRFGLCLARAALPRWESNHTDRRPRECVLVVERWLSGAPGQERDLIRREARLLCTRLLNVANAAAADAQNEEAIVFQFVVALLSLIWQDKRETRSGFMKVMTIASGMPDGGRLTAAAAGEFVEWLLSYAHGSLVAEHRAW